LKQITVLSGKGGTGKTTLVASFAALSQDCVVVDCDVDAPNLHMLLKPEIIKTQKFEGSKLAQIDMDKCVQCEKCEEACRFDAITDHSIDNILCEGCGVCSYLCPAEAITLEKRISGYAFISKTEYGPMSHARLEPGESNSGKLVTLVRGNARKAAEKENKNLILNDGSPGIGCSVIASITGVDIALVVVEPSMSGIHDMERVQDLLIHFQIEPLVCINKYDINLENTKKIVEFCENKNIEVVGKLSFDPIVTKAMVAGKPVVKYSPKSLVSKEITESWEETLSSLNVTSHKRGQ